MRVHGLMNQDLMVFSILVKHLQDGIERREKNEERICITLSEEAKASWDTQSKRIRELMQKERSCITMMISPQELWSKLRESQQ